jgi:4-hydroxy 2-oxovalerate aldolase
MSDQLKELTLLDCTLRDGGYYTNWDFSNALVETYFDSFNSLPVKYLEIGYRSNPMNSYLGEYFYCPEYVLRNARKLSEKKLAIILNEKDVRAEDVPQLLGSCTEYIDLVRMAVDPKNLARAIELARAVKSLGYEVAFNVMYMSTWQSLDGFMEQLPAVNEVADYFYLVDSFGGVYPADVAQTMKMVKEHVHVSIGFHGHNNLELGLINTLTAIEHGATIVDATVTGMGRGAGNLKTELLLTALNARHGWEVNFNKLSAVVDGFEQLKEQYHWGTNLPYMVSGANSLPQKDVMEWVSKRYYSFNSIIRALQNQKEGIKDNRRLPVFEPEKKYHSAILIGGGPSAKQHAKAINALVNQLGNTCLIHSSSRNSGHYLHVQADQYYALVGSEGHRLEKLFDSFGLFSGTCLLPPFPRKMGTYIPEKVAEQTYELTSISGSQLPDDSSTVIAIETAIKLGVEKIYITGYDGYADTSMGEKEQALFLENNLIFEQYNHMGIMLRAITPTKYPALKLESLYALML